ncbi:Ser/Thr phosphatase family protein [Cardiosporidium cionae]|uniref:Ser/Thr phosphatase family protein n=1 Tax=Cardiosporidium cionae TaxID=476202 RepID=A0ABQ7JAT1_9APIC|nr:Ser/Thr phosphatase family protein [Cardiosporidium cionae]|eukprot:KAF8821058.1 Ser/Thr phosphatase family protein [Cardiosporidium cionae]
MVYVAIEGCCHGELNTIYETLAKIESSQGISVDLLICCGDFQKKFRNFLMHSVKKKLSSFNRKTVRTAQDLECLTCPPKYRTLHDFHLYYSGKRKAPILTLFIGGNHEAPHVLKEFLSYSQYSFEKILLYYGGWVAPNIFYLGHSGVVNVGGIRIAALSGIFKGKDYSRGYYETLPYTEDSRRSAYHIREFEIQKLSMITGPVDIMITHDWPRGIEKYGNWQSLIRRKPHFKEEIMTQTFGNPVTWNLVTQLKPKFWFSAHLHVKFAAFVPHSEFQATRFLALDKVLPGRSYMQLLNLTSSQRGYTVVTPSDVNSRKKSLRIAYDSEWMAILKATHRNLPVGYTYPKSQLIEPSNDDILSMEMHLSTLCAADTSSNDLHAYWPSWEEYSHTDLAAQREYFLKVLGVPMRGNLASDERNSPKVAAATYQEGVSNEEEIDINVDVLLSMEVSNTTPVNSIPPEKDEITIDVDTFLTNIEDSTSSAIILSSGKETCCAEMDALQVHTDISNSSISE